MSGVRRRRGRAAAVLAGLVCAAGLAGCDSGGDDWTGPSADAPAATSAPAAPTAAKDATKDAAADEAKPCDLLTTDLAYEVFQQTPDAADTDSPTMCSYPADGSTGLGDTLSLAVEKWQDGLTIQDEVDNLGIQGPNGQDNPQPLTDPDLGPGAVDVWDDGSVAVVWKDGDVHKLVVTGVKAGREPDARALVIDVAHKIYTGKRS